MHEDISSVSATDYDRLVEVWELSVRATHDFVADEDIEIFRPIVRKVLPTLDLACIRDAQGVAIGYIALADGNIEMLFIHPDWRGKGFGRNLIRYAIDKRGATLVDVNEQNTRALEFYLHMGFEVVSRSELDSVGKPYPILHMRLAPVKGHQEP